MGASRQGGDKATEKLMKAALGSSSDVEAATASTSSSLAPVWVQQSERIRVEMNLVKERLNKLKEWVWALGRASRLCSLLFSSMRNACMLTPR